MEANITIIGISEVSILPKGGLSLIVLARSKTAVTAFFIVNTLSHYNALLGCDLTHTAWFVPSTLHQCLVFWNKQKDEVEIVQADKKPFLLESHVVEAQFYDYNLAPLKF